MAWNKRSIMICVLLILGILTWSFYVAPQFLRYPSDFYYSADVVSLDNFYDEEKKIFLGEQLSKTRYYFETIEHQAGILLIRNTFDVWKMTGERIFSVDRLYGISPWTGQHVKGYGDHDREGYLFAPDHLHKQDYVYWHINYDEPALMKFQNEEKIKGVRVYRYAADYHADQTANLGFLPGVPTQRGVELDIHLEQWIEPVSGQMVKYEDHTTAYYYDQKTKERLYPWNEFSNKYSTTSVNDQIKAVKMLKRRDFLQKKFIPVLLGAALCAFFGVSIMSRKE